MQNPSPSAQTFDFYPIRIEFTALDPFHFPAPLSANVFRGALGFALHEISRARYKEIFTPRLRRERASGFAHPPRPFVLRSRHLDGRSIDAGQAFYIDLHLFTTRSPAIADLLASFRMVADRGFGPLGSRASVTFEHSTTPVSLPLTPGRKSISRIRVDFLSPTELKANNKILEVPAFEVLFRRILGRISTLRRLYGAGQLEIDFDGLNERAAKVWLAASELHHVSASRRSSRTGQRHPLGGFIGFAEYEGALSEFLPYLEIACWTGVGRQSVWGKGEIAVHELR